MSDPVDRTATCERKACPDCGDPGFVNPNTGRWQCGNAGCENTDEVDVPATCEHGFVVRLDRTGTTAAAYARCTCGWVSRRYVGVKQEPVVRDATAAGEHHANEAFHA